MTFPWSSTPFSRLGTSVIGVELSMLDVAAGAIGVASIGGAELPVSSSNIELSIGRACTSLP